MFCVEAQNEFHYRYWPCEKTDEKTGLRCVNVASGHTKGHQNLNGAVFAVGSFESSFEVNPEEQNKDFLATIVFELDKHIRLLRQEFNETNGNEETQWDEEQAAAKIHRIHALAPLAEVWSTDRNGKKSQPLMSHTTCFCCLMYSPEHKLYCGHIICQRCLENYSTLPGDRFYRRLEFCPLCNKPAFLWKIKEKPPTAGLRVLSLDG